MDLHARTERLSQLLERRLDVRGADFETKLRRAGRLLPRHLRRDGAALVEAMHLSSHPKLGRQIDAQRLAKSADALEHYLHQVDPWDRRRAVLISVASSVLFSLLVVALLVAGMIAWRGLI
ncbi:hypothetical protein [Aliiroseovarius sediminis]|uniref:hypothetical protein n=1 Tax=Aliiroseovarius sediminis TaxID=2925839 RepID=UPI001F58AB8A|nr:hypothetical protein [Aliiroseovarius sediminis]MCI2395211.1 hypothetical protein [Aliiroseovarius sediminis]